MRFTNTEMGIKSAIEESLTNLAAGDPYTVYEGAIDADLAGRLATEALDLPRLFFRDGPDWVNTKRATFFPRGSEPGIIWPVSHFLSSDAWVPETQRLAASISNTVNQLSATSTLPSSILGPLASWKPNRVGFNLTQGSTSSPGLIPNHIDPEALKGLVSVVELAGDSPGTMKVIYCKDICDVLGLKQAIHGVNPTTSLRLSATIAMLVK